MIIYYAHEFSGPGIPMGHNGMCGLLHCLGSHMEDSGWGLESSVGSFLALAKNLASAVG